jgi:hypothetical protein
VRSRLTSAEPKRAGHTSMPNGDSRVGEREGAAVALAISGGGALSSLETTVLLTVDETLDALRNAQQLQYKPPGA